MGAEHRGKSSDAKKLAELQLLAERCHEAEPEGVEIDGQGWTPEAGSMLEVTAASVDGEEWVGTEMKSRQRIADG
jgi:hypothetical protein